MNPNEPNDLPEAIEGMPGLSTASDAIDAFYLKLDRKMGATNNDAALDGVGNISTGFRDLDLLTSGIFSSELLVIAGRPGVGKTSLVINLANNVLLASKTVLFVPLDQPKESLAESLLSCSSEVGLRRLRSGKINSSEQELLFEQGERSARQRLLIDELPGRFVEQLGENIRILKAKSNLELVVVDYFQLLETSGFHRNQQDQWAFISRSLKKIAIDHSVAVVITAPITPWSKSPAYQRPTLYDLREVGTLSEDADSVWILHESPLGPDTETFIYCLEIIVEKSRRGPVGIARLLFEKQFLRLKEWPLPNQD